MIPESLWQTLGVDPMDHQPVGVERLVREPVFALFDEMGMGKSLQAAVAGQLLYQQDAIDTIVLICPASVKPVWMDPDVGGEIMSRAFVDYTVHHFNGRNLIMKFVPGVLNWVVCSYEFLRYDLNARILGAALKNRRALIILDESSFIKNHKSKQTKAVLGLRPLAEYRWLLNGTPTGGNPLDLYAQLAFLDPAILGFKNYYHMRARHAVMGGYMQHQVLKFVNLEELSAKVAPFCLRRTKADCLNLIPKAYSIAEVRLTPPTWRLYRQMRDEMVVWLGGQVSMTAHAVTKILRLSQITSGFLGGFVSSEIEEENSAPRPAQEVGEEKLDYILEWVRQRIEEDATAHIIVWCRFRPEIERLASRLLGQLGPGRVQVLQGAQPRRDREAALRLMHPDTAPKEACVLVAQPQAGKFGLNLTAATYVTYVSQDYNLLTRQQSEDRVHRKGQRRQTYFLDVMAAGPEGQKTIDHRIVKALRNKENLAALTVDAWREILEEE